MLKRQEEENIMKLYHLDPIEFMNVMNHLDYYKGIHELSRFAFVNNLKYCHPATLIEYKERIKNYSFIAPLATMRHIYIEVEFESMYKWDIHKELEPLLDILEKMKPMITDLERHDYELLYGDLLAKYYSMRTGII